MASKLMQSGAPERAGRALRTSEEQLTEGNVVPGGGIEPPTRGFSVQESMLECLLNMRNQGGVRFPALPVSPPQWGRSGVRERTHR